MITRSKTLAIRSRSTEGEPSSQASPPAAGGGGAIVLASPTHAPPRTGPPPPPPPPQSLRPSERQATASKQYKHHNMKTINIYSAKDGSLTDKAGSRVSVTASGYAIYDKLGNAVQVQPTGGRPVTREGSPAGQARPTAPPPPAPAATSGYVQPRNGNQGVLQGADSQASISEQGDNVSNHSHHSQGDNGSIDRKSVV